ncbi:MAG: putative RNA methyltransferase [Litorivicinus sp.]
MTLKCPICDAPLVVEMRTASCPANHSFDQAREGYWNLLPAHHKNSALPGDSKAMLQARRRFLEAEHYQPLADALKGYLQGDVLDIGCGEGYYARTLDATAGLDIAKDGVKMAAKRHPQATYVTASATRLPFVSESFDTLVNVFSPLHCSEAARVLRPDGRLIWVGPQARHLNELAGLVYDEVRPHQAKPPINETPQTEQLLNFQLTLAGPELIDLLAMTPYYWSASAEKQKAIAASPSMDISVAFDLRVYDVGALSRAAKSTGDGIVETPSKQPKESE